MDATEPGVLGVNLKLNPLEESIPKFLRHWFKQAARSDEINSDLQIDRAELRKFFTNIGKYILQKDYISNMISNFDIFDVVQNPGDIKAVRNYLLWNIGEKIYYLEYQDENSSPKEPVQIPNNLPFNEFILTVWDDQLPEIYAGNFTMRQPTAGDKVLNELAPYF